MITQREHVGFLTEKELTEAIERIKNQGMRDRTHPISYEKLDRLLKELEKEAVIHVVYTGDLKRKKAK